jgi:hypothetical protein
MAVGRHVMGLPDFQILKKNRLVDTQNAEKLETLDGENMRKQHQYISKSILEILFCILL